jgi:hypothetical protein
MKKTASGKRRLKQGEKYLLLLSMLKAVLCNSFKKGITKFISLLQLYSISGLLKKL